MGHLRQSYSVGKGGGVGDREKRVGREFTRGGWRQGKEGGEGIYERGFRREEETRRSTKGGIWGGWIHYQELQIWLRCKLHAYQLTTETSQSSICPAENGATLWHKATT